MWQPYKTNQPISSEWLQSHEQPLPMLKLRFLVDMNVNKHLSLHKIWGTSLVHWWRLASYFQWLDCLVNTLNTMQLRILYLQVGFFWWFEFTTFVWQFREGSLNNQPWKGGEPQRSGSYEVGCRISALDKTWIYYLDCAVITFAHDCCEKCNVNLLWVRSFLIPIL